MGVGQIELLGLLDQQLRAERGAGRSATIIRRFGSARRSASSADSATTAFTVRKVRGSASSGEGRNGVR